MDNIPRYMKEPDPTVYMYGRPLFLDFETTNIEKGTALNDSNRIVLACWEDAEGTMHHKWGGEMEQKALVMACNDADFLVAHNAKFELQWLDRCGYDIGSRPVWCTMVGEWVISGNRRWKLSLDECLARRGMEQKDSTVNKLIKAGVCPSDIPRSLLLRYGLLDVRQTAQLFYHQRDIDFEGTRLLGVQYTRCLVIPPLADIEKNGLHLDSERVEKEYEEHVHQYQKVMAELDEITGGINPNSPPQVAHFVYGELGFTEKTDKSGNPIRNSATKQFPEGQPKTDEATLLSLGASTDEQKRFLRLKKEQAKLAAALNKNLSMFVGACREKNGMIYAALMQGRTVTHRLASAGRSTYYKMFDARKGCQFQNLPRKFKHLFSARKKGWLFAEADGSSLEFGTAGFVGKEPLIAEEIRSGYDVHRYTASVMFNKPEDEVTHGERTVSKRDTFKPLYGGRSGTPAQQRYYQAFTDKYPNLHASQEGWCIEAEATKKLETEWGMIFHFPHARYNQYGYLNCKTNVYNIPIQSLATADIIPIGLAYCWHRTRDMEMFLVNTVHDSIEAELPENERELFETIVVQSLTNDVYDYLYKVYDLEYTVPLGVGMVIGRNWGEPLEGEDEIKIQMETPNYE